VLVTGGTLGGGGTVGGIVAQNGGTVAPGVLTPLSTLNVNGNVSFAPGSTLAVNPCRDARTILSSRNARRQTRPRTAS
jgi:uncharacterized protein with beta-barrel porin domain